MPERDQHESIGKKIEGLLARAKGEEHTGASSPAGHVPATVPPHSHGGSSSPESKTAALDTGGSIDPSTQSGTSPGLLAGSGILDAFGTTITIGATVKLAKCECAGAFPKRDGVRCSPHLVLESPGDG